MSHKAFFNLGSKLVLANTKQSADVFNHSQGLVDRLRQPDSGAFHREVAKIAAAAYLADDMQSSMQYHLFEKLASAKEWHVSYQRFTMPVLSALAKFANRQDADLEKRAAAVAGVGAGAVLSGVESMHPLAKILLGLGTITGVGAGSLGFLLSRDARESSAENNAITEKTRAYKQLRRDIEEDLAASGALDEEKEGPKRYAL